MDIDKIKDMSLDEIRSMYKLYLQDQNLSSNTVNTSYVDAFYLWRKESSELFWSVVTSINFEIEAKKSLVKALKGNSKGNVNSQISGYMLHLRRFRVFLNTDIFSPKQEPKQTNKLEHKYLSITEENIAKSGINL